MRNSYLRVAVISALLIGAIASAGAIKSWSAGDTLSSTDLNANFTHIHNAMVGGHGARLVDADVSTSAAISTAKIQNGRGIARAWAGTEAACSGSPCTVAESLNISSITRSSTGTYLATLSYTATDADFLVQASTQTVTAHCFAQSTSTTTIQIYCYDYDAAIGPTATDAAFGIVVYDGD